MVNSTNCLFSHLTLFFAPQSFRHQMINITFNYKDMLLYKVDILVPLGDEIKPNVLSAFVTSFSIEKFTCIS